jgi:hypothetical protein
MGRPPSILIRISTSLAAMMMFFYSNFSSTSFNIPNYVVLGSRIQWIDSTSYSEDVVLLCPHPYFVF